MRPIKLTMSAFGPYAKKEVIDFDNIGEEGLYLISGDTGSGKTMIFDAIVYALYGTSSGFRRQASDFRSKSAELDEETYVEFVFECNHKQYTIRRNPEYERVSQRSKNKTTKQTSSVSLIVPDNPVPYTRVDDVKTQIDKILHITKEQFMQIVMIAQNDFIKVLSADTDTRQNLLRSIFLTDKYKQLEIQLQIKNKECSDNYILIKERMFNLVKDYPELFPSVNTSKDFVWQDEYLSKLKDLEKQSKSDLVCVDKDLTDVENKIAELNQLLGELRNKKIIIDSLAANIVAKPKIKMELDDAETQWVDAQKFTSKNIDEAKKKANLIEEKLPQYNELSQINNTIQQTTQNLNQIKQVFETDNQKLINSQQKLAQLVSQFENLRNCGNDTQDLTKTLSEIHLQGETCNKILSLFDQASDKYTELNVVQESYKQASSEYEKASRDYDNQHRLFLDAQAGILAENLEENSPCPVCGSLHHPNLAKKPTNVLSENEIKKLRAKKDENERLSGLASDKCSRCKTDYDNKLELIQEQLQWYNSNFATQLQYSQTEHDNLKNIIITKRETLRLQYSEIDKQLKEIKANLEKQTIIENEIKKLRAENDSLKQKTFETTNEITRLETSIANNTANMNRMKSNLEFETKEKAENQLQIINKTISDLQANFKFAQDNYNEVNLEYQKIKNSIDEETKQLGNPENIDVYMSSFEKNYSQSETQLENEQNKKNSLETRKKDLNIKISKASETINKITNHKATFDKLERQAQIYENLYETVSGKISGFKMSFEVFIQSCYFENVLYNANKRLKGMTCNQYELVRSDKTDGRGAKGLDILVHDVTNDTKREVSTLSGGESFQAALALAFGFSDLIQSSSEVKIQSMFVDEGFGTLDKESLKKAISSLGKVADNRLVGIISHVEELQSFINKKIVVEKKDGISQTKVEA